MLADPDFVFSAEVSAQLKRIELTTARLVESLFSGEYHSIFKGRGLEFSDVREYQPGDDVRSIDWNVTARRGHLFVKEFVEERQLNALIVVDLSASKTFGTGAKQNSIIASEIAAILALAATTNNDRVGLLLVTDKVEYFIPPDTGRRHAMRLVLELLSHRPESRSTMLSAGLRYADRVLRQKTTVFLISDFLTGPKADSELIRAARKLAWYHDLVPIRLIDPATGSLPRVGMLALDDPETGHRRVLNTNKRKVRDSWKAHSQQVQERMSDLFRDLKLDVVDVDTRHDYLPPLIGFFRRRARMQR